MLVSRGKVIPAGDPLPAASLLTTFGDREQLAEALGSKPAVVVFYRGSWCPYCNLALKSYQQELLPVGNVLASALAILTEPTKDARAAHTQLGFDVADNSADHTGNIPFPTVLNVDGEGVVVFADVHVDYTTRTEVNTITDQVRTLISAR